MSVEMSVEEKALELLKLQEDLGHLDREFGETMQAMNSIKKQALSENNPDKAAKTFLLQMQLEDIQTQFKEKKEKLDGLKKEVEKGIQKK